MEIRPIDLDDRQVQALLRLHLAEMRADSPPSAVYALDRSGLEDPAVSFVGLWDDGELLSFGAIKQLAPDHGEIKSMRTAPQHLRRGAAARVLDHLIGLARQRGYRRVSLETGSSPAFEPALALYRRHGFVPGPVFGGYAATEFNQFLHLDLSPSAG